MIALPLLLAQAFALKDGDVVLFYGDSITEQRLYTTYVETFVRTRFPKLDAEFITVGVGGDATWGGWAGDAATRVERDVKPFQPTRIVIMLGMNDGGYVPYDAKIEQIFVDWYRKLLGYMRSAAPKAKLTLVQTSPFDDFTKRPSPFAGYNATLLKLGKNIVELSRQEGADFVDFNAPFVAAMSRASNPEAFLPDMIHPGPPGHLVMASVLLKDWHAPSTVADVALDAREHKVVRADNTLVTGFDGLRWTQKDNALPFPLDESTRPGADAIGFQTDLNRQMLMVTGLEAGRYSLSIDGQTVSVFSDMQLAAGVNLADYDTPMLRQATQVLDLITKRNEVFFLWWQRMGCVMNGFSGTQEVIAALKKLEKSIAKEARSAALPLSHRYELSPVKEASE
ncbi:MAG: hypothetical protein AMXMBFR61_05660 [Fimbriimonadales bacterium]